MAVMSRKDKEKRKVRYASAKEGAEKHDAGFTPTSFVPPDGVRLFRFPKDTKTHRLILLPYLVGKGNKQADEGMVYYTRVYKVHTKVGANNNSYACMRENFDEPCYVCDDRIAELRREGSMTKGQWGMLGPKDRCLFLVIDTDDENLDWKKPEESVQLFETAFYMMFGELLHNRVKLLPEDDPRLDFWHLEDGMMLEVGVKQTKGNAGRDYGKPISIDFVPRKHQFDDGLLEKLPCLDDLIAPIDPDKLKSYFLQIPAGGDKEVDQTKNGKAPGKKGTKITRSDEEDEEGEEGEDEETTMFKLGDYVMHNGLQCEVKKVLSNGTYNLEDDDGETYKAVDAGDCEAIATAGSGDDDDEEELEDDEEEETPKKKAGAKKPSAKSRDDDEDEDPDDDDVDDESDDDEDPDDDDEPTQPPKKKAGPKPPPKKPGRK